MLIEQALRTWLLSQTAVTAYVGRRIEYNRIPEGIQAPYMIISKIDGPRVQSHEGNSHLAHPRFQFTVFADTYSDAKNCISALRGVLQGYSGTMGGISGVKVGNARYEDETDLDPGEEGMYGVAADYILWHYE